MLALIQSQNSKNEVIFLRETVKEIIQNNFEMRIKLLNVISLLRKSKERSI